MYEKIKMLCKEKGISIRTLESACGLSHGSVSKWDKHEPSHGKLYTVADYLGVSVNYLLSENPDTADAPVQKNEQPGYYTNPETAKKAQELFDDPKYRVLFDAAEGSDPDDLQMAADLLLRLKQTRRD